MLAKDLWIATERVTTISNNGDMTRGPDDGAARRPSWYSSTQPEHSPTGYEYPGYYPPAGPYRCSDTPGTDELNRAHDAQVQQGQAAATAALVLSIIGFFTVPFILGPIAVWQAAKARRYGHPAPAGRLLGWICTLWGVALIALPFLFFLLMLLLSAI